MVDFYVLGLVAAFLASCVTALPPLGERSPQDGPLIPTSSEYYLQTKVISVAPYHVMAGENDVTLVSDITQAAKGFLNETGTYQEFDLEDDVPWGLNLYLYSDTVYSDWQPAQINVGFGTAGFFINGSGLQNPQAKVAGWLACDWWHLAPQLFWLFNYDGASIPCSCAVVELCVVAV